MNLGFYTHGDAVFEPDESARIPSVFGNQVRALAERAGSMTIYLHGSSGAAGTEDFPLSAPLFRPIDLGPRRSGPARSLRPHPALTRFDPRRDGVDVMLIQGPSPLLPHLVRASSGSVPVALLIWGDYGGWRSQPQFPAWRNAAIKGWVKLYSWQQRRASRGLLTYLNNPLLASSVPDADTRMVTFTSVSEAMLEQTEPVSTDWGARGRSEPLRLVYSGRIVRDKGMIEAAGCIGLLKGRGVPATLDLIGWTDNSDLTVNEFRRVTDDLGVTDLVRLRGYIPAGPSLWRAYTEADVFVIPTYWDSLPRAMLEAMAIGLPVVATGVGGIGHHLRDRETALFVEPRRADQLADAVELLIADPGLRARIARDGRHWATQNTLESESAAMIAELRDRLTASNVGL